MTKTLAATFLGATMLCIATASEAATVRSLTGEMLVNQGTGFKTATGFATMAPGTLVMVAAGAKAQIAYEDGCIVEVAPGRVEMVSTQSPCAAQGASSITTGATPPLVVAPAAVGVPTTYLVGGAVAVAGIGGFVAVRNAQQAEERRRHAASP